MNIYLELITILAEVMLFVCFFIRYINIKDVKYIFSILFLFFYSFSLTLGTFFLSPFIRIFVLIGVIFLGNYLLFKINPLQLLYLVILFFTSSIIADLLASSMISFCFHSSLQKISQNQISLLIYYSIAKLFHLIFLILIHCCFDNKRSNRSILGLIPLITCHLVSCIIFYINYNFLISGINTKYVATATISLLYINIALFFYVELMRKNYDEREKLIVAEQQLQMNEKFYTDIMRRQEDTRSLWHDIKKYILAIETLVSNNDQESAIIQTKKILDSYEQIRYTVDSGNCIIDSILNHESILARQNNIDFDLNLWISPHVSIDATDLYVILGNTIDNAIEACSMLEPDIKRHIKISLHEKENLLFYEISNPFSIKSNSKSNNKKFHGYGLTNVKKIVHNNQGSMKITKTTGVFTVTIILNIA